MNMVLLGVIIFALSLLTIELIAYAIRIIRHPDKNIVRHRLRHAGIEKNDAASETIYKKKKFSEVPLVHNLLALVPGIRPLQSMVNQANVNFSLGTFLFLSIALGGSAYLLGYLWTRYFPLALLMGSGAGCLPLWYVYSKKKKRMAKFEKQLPEALGLIARSLKAGHAFTSGMKMAADEYPDPLGPEFHETLDMINFGLSMPEALKTLAKRVDCPDLKFFVVSVILQRETGGNLAEIIESLAYLIRQRFKFRGKVRILSAEGRLSALILYVLPFALGTFLFVFHPQVVAPLHEDSIGRAILWIMGGMMVSGFILIRRIVKVDV